MIRREDRWLNLQGLNLIRIMIGSYFAAVSLELVSSINPKALFLPFMPDAVADLIGSTLLFVVSIAFMIGVSLRLSALILAIFVFSSSLMQNFILLEFSDISAFWRDLTLVCAVILTYSTMNRHDLRKADLARRSLASRVRKVQVAGSEIMPRRISARKPEKDRADDQEPPALVLPSFMKPPSERPENKDLVDVNLFANI